MFDSTRWRVVDPDVRGDLQASRIAAGEKSAPVTRAPRPSPRQGVDPEVALQVQQGPSSYVTDRRDLLVPEPDAAGAEPGEVVELALGVDRGHASHSRWFAANDAACPPRSVIRATRGRAHPGRGRRSCKRTKLPSRSRSGLLLARQGAQLLLEPIDPATGEAVEGDIRDGGHGEIRWVDALDSRSALGSSSVSRLSSSFRASMKSLGCPGRWSRSRLREQVEPRRVHPATEREVCPELLRVAEGAVIVGPMRMRIALVARDELHPGSRRPLDQPR